jgi:serine/threonine-protein kinase
MSVRYISERSSGELPAIGSVVAGKYRIVSRLGSGGSATVSLAVSQGLAGFSKLVVLKSIRGGAKAPNRSIDMFLNEARLSARLNHPHVVQVYEVAEHDALPVIVMEYLDGHSLASVLAGAFDLPDFTRELRLTIMTKVLAGLHYAHTLRDFSGRALELVHRDVTPQNVMVTYDGQVKLVDFGVAQMGGSSRRPRTHKIAGKLGYMAPEQMHGRCDRRADVFAAGILLWELITLRRFWGNQKEADVMRQLLAFDIPQRRTLAAEMGDQLAQICARALAPDPAARYATAAEMQADLERHLLEHSSFVMESTIGQLVQRACGGQGVRSRSTMAPWMGHLDAPLVQGVLNGAPSAGAVWGDESAPGVSARAHSSSWPAPGHWAVAIVIGLFLCHAGDTAPVDGARAAQRSAHEVAEPAPSTPISAESRAPLPPELDVPEPREPADGVPMGEPGRSDPEVDVGRRAAAVDAAPRASEATTAPRAAAVEAPPGSARGAVAAAPKPTAARPAAKRGEAAAQPAGTSARPSSDAPPPRAKRARPAKARERTSFEIEPGMDLRELPRAPKVEDGLLRRER